MKMATVCRDLLNGGKVNSRCKHKKTLMLSSVNKSQNTEYWIDLNYFPSLSLGKLNQQWNLYI
jgi:hypothetical protein